MNVAPYYQKLLDECLKVAKSLEPITFIGMFDSGVDYLFTLSVPFFRRALKNTKIAPVFIDLSGLATPESIISEISFALSEELNTPLAHDVASFTTSLRKAAEKTKIVFVLYLGQEGTTDQGLFLLLNRARNLLGWKFSYCIFATTRLLQNPSLTTPVIEKVLKRNMVPVLPLTREDTNVVLDNYEERYKKKIPQEQETHIIALSGGNPGLIKALYLQVLADPSWKVPHFLDEQLFFRLKGIASDLSPMMIDAIKAGRSELPPEEDYLLKQYGYVVIKNSKQTVFTPMLSEFLKHYSLKTPQASKPFGKPADETILHFTKSQRSVLDYLRSHAGELVSKDTLAQVLWGENWTERYSDWAIDQLLSTLREKLASLKYKEKIITKKGEGIIFLAETE